LSKPTVLIVTSALYITLYLFLSWVGSSHRPQRQYAHTKANSRHRNYKTAEQRNEKTFAFVHGG